MQNLTFKKVNIEHIKIKFSQLIVMEWIEFNKKKIPEHIREKKKNSKKLTSWYIKFAPKF